MTVAIGGYSLTKVSSEAPQHDRFVREYPTSEESPMSVSVRIPTILRTYTGGESEVKAEGTTLTEILDDLDSNYSGIKGRIIDEKGELRRFVNVYVGNDDVRFLDNLETATPEGTEISVIPAVAGGS